MVKKNGQGNGHADGAVLVPLFDPEERAREIRDPVYVELVAAIRSANPDDERISQLLRRLGEPHPELMAQFFALAIDIDEKLARDIEAGKGMRQRAEEKRYAHEAALRFIPRSLDDCDAHGEAVARLGRERHEAERLASTAEYAEEHRAGLRAAIPRLFDLPADRTPRFPYLPPELSNWAVDQRLELDFRDGWVFVSAQSKARRRARLVTRPRS